ncbi:hypothetical protein GGI12_001674 [Dipsacomyces acuminosporus]|nr:hypothetical protein GGI12_001674 [Dipsacomyces acuminosporus]
MSVAQQAIRNQRQSWVFVLGALGVAAVGSAVYFAGRHLKADHERTLRIRHAKRRHKELVAELSECKGILNYMDQQVLPQAQTLADEAQRLKEEDSAANAQRVDAIKRELLGIGEQLLRLMERIDGVAPAHVLDAARLDPWAEHEDDLKNNAYKQGLKPVFDLTSDIRAIRKGLIRKAERRAQKVDSLKRLAFPG